MLTEEAARKEYAHAQQNIRIMTEVCDNLPSSLQPIVLLAWHRGYAAGIKTVLEED